MTAELDELAHRTLAQPPTTTPTIGAVHEMAADRQRRRARRFAIATVTVCVVLLGGVWATLNSRAATVETVTGAGQPSPVDAGMGQFVWPAPSRGFQSADRLAEAFIAEVLGWDDAFTTAFDDAPSDPDGPTWIQISRSGTDATVEALAVPSDAGWGFVQIGNDPVSIRQDSPTTGRLWFAPPPDTSTNATVRYATTSVEIATDEDFVELPHTPAWYDVTSVLVVHRNEAGEVVGVAGGQFALEPAEDPFAITTTVPPDAVAPRQLDTIEDIEQLVDAYGTCVITNAQGGALALRLDRANGTIDESQTSHPTPAGLDTVDAHADLCDASLAFTTSLLLADRLLPAKPDTEWIIFGDASLGFADSDLIIEVRLTPTATGEQTDAVGALLSTHPEVEQVTFTAPSTYRITPRDPTNIATITSAVAELDPVARIWTVSPI